MRKEAETCWVECRYYKNAHFFHHFIPRLHLVDNTEAGIGRAFHTLVLCIRNLEETHSLCEFVKHRYNLG